MNYNSTKNQYIKNQLVQREILTNASMLISEVQERSEELSMEILELFFSSVDYQQAMEEHYHQLSTVERGQLLQQHGVNSYDELDPEEVCDWEGIEPEIIEPLEFWIVTDRMGEKLQAQGEIVQEFLGLTIWGRTCSGQAILLDHCIGKIAEDMEILEGMSNEWK